MIDVLTEAQGACCMHIKLVKVSKPQYYSFYKFWWARDAIIVYFNDVYKSYDDSLYMLRARETC